MDYENMTVAELKDLLREAKLPVSGKKADLITRLLDNSEPTNTDDEDDLLEEEQIEDEFVGDDDFEEEWDDFHTARQKPILDDETKEALKVRSAQKKKQPAFRRQEWFRYKRLSKTGWRKPRGDDSSQRKNRKYRSPMARVGYGKISQVRDLHPSGFEEILVNTAADLDGINPERQAIRIASSVGNRKRAGIHDRADNLGLRILNRRRIRRKGDLI